MYHAIMQGSWHDWMKHFGWYSIILKWTKVQYEHSDDYKGKSKNLACVFWMYGQRYNVFNCAFVCALYVQ